MQLRSSNLLGMTLPDYFASEHARTSCSPPSIVAAGLRLDQNISMSDSSAHLLFAGGYQGQIITLSFDPTARPALKRISATTEAGIAPTWLCLSRDGAYLCEFLHPQRGPFR